MCKANEHMQGLHQRVLAELPSRTGIVFTDQDIHSQLLCHGQTTQALKIQESTEQCAANRCSKPQSQHGTVTLCFTATPLLVDCQGHYGTH